MKLKRSLVIFLDKNSPLSIHLAPISQLGFKDVIIIRDSQEKDNEIILHEIKETLDTFIVDFSIISMPTLSYIDSLIMIGNDFLFKKQHSDTHFVVNLSTKKIPGMFAFIDACCVLDIDYTVLYLPQDGSGNWLRKELCSFTPVLIRRSLINSDHLQFLKILSDQSTTHREGFRLDDVLSYMKMVNPVLQTKKIYEDLNMTSRKRVYDFINPLLELRLIRKTRAKYATYFLNYENELEEGENDEENNGVL